MEYDATFIDAHLALADVLINQERFEEAIVVAERCIGTYPLIEYPIFMKAFCLYRLGKFVEAES